jgi:hypothetical protein
MDSYGVDISLNALKILKPALPKEVYQLIDSYNSMPRNKYCHLKTTSLILLVAESCLDSMPSDVAKYIAELKRVCSGLIYTNLIGKYDEIAADEFEVTTKYERGTYQTTFDEEKKSLNCSCQK